ncbi:hypothetical protein GGP53_002956 [Salinibacter ruber]|nr:hypothetical protein [Salinibacter ruber]MCS3629096.1 hypothetical protein [Salinibacter ruber]MCS4145985.1 hypothetical protein [Salinibacter ruber]
MQVHRPDAVRLAAEQARHGHGHRQEGWGRKRHDRVVTAPRKQAPQHLQEEARVVGDPPERRLPPEGGGADPVDVHAVARLLGRHVHLAGQVVVPAAEHVHLKAVRRQMLGEVRQVLGRRRQVWRVVLVDEKKGGSS